MADHYGALKSFHDILVLLQSPEFRQMTQQDVENAIQWGVHIESMLISLSKSEVSSLESQILRLRPELTFPLSLQVLQNARVAFLRLAIENPWISQHPNPHLFIKWCLDALLDSFPSMDVQESLRLHLARLFSQVCRDLRISNTQLIAKLSQQLNTLLGFNEMCPPTYFSSSTIIPRIAQARLILSRLIEEEEDLSSNSFHFFGRPVVETLKSHLHEPECFETVSLSLLIVPEHLQPENIERANDPYEITLPQKQTLFNSAIHRRLFSVLHSHLSQESLEIHESDVQESIAFYSLHPVLISRIYSIYGEWEEYVRFCLSAMIEQIKRFAGEHSLSTITDLCFAPLESQSSLSVTWIGYATRILSLFDELNVGKRIELQILIKGAFDVLERIDLASALLLKVQLLRCFNE